MASASGLRHRFAEGAAVWSGDSEREERKIIVTPAGARLDIEDLTDRQQALLIASAYAPDIRTVSSDKDRAAFIFQEIRVHLGHFPKDWEEQNPLCTRFWRQFDQFLQGEASRALQAFGKIRQGKGPWKAVNLTEDSQKESPTSLEVRGVNLLAIPLALAKFQTLERVLLVNDRIRSIIPSIFNDLPKLRQLDLSSNMLTGIPYGFLSRCHLLQALDLSSNRLTVIPRGFLSGCHLLQMLDLSNNKITGIPHDLLYGSPSLQVLELRHNQLQSIPEGFFKKSSKLLYLDLRENQIQEHGDFNDCLSLMNLRFSNNCLRTIDTGKFEKCRQLQTTEFSYNQIGDRPLKLGGHVLAEDEIDENPCCRASRRARDVCGWAST